MTWAELVYNFRLQYETGEHISRSDLAEAGRAAGQDSDFDVTALFGAADERAGGTRAIGAVRLQRSAWPNNECTECHPPSSNRSLTYEAVNRKGYGRGGRSRGGNRRTQE